MRGLWVLAVLAAASPMQSYAAQERSDWTIADSRAPHTRGDAHLTANDFARVNTQRFSRCMLERHRESIEAALTLPPDSAAYTTLSKMVDANCLTGGRMISMPAEVMRSGLFVAQYQRDFDKNMPPFPAVATGLSARLPADTSRSRIVALRGIADCLWRADPDGSRAAIMSVPGTRDEMKAYGSLEDHLRGCSPTRPVHFSKAVLGGLLAEVAFLELAPSAAVS